jgi:hypothetical protein
MWIVIILVFSAVALAAYYWYVVLAALLLAVIVRLAAEAWGAHAAARADQRRHERARQTIACIEAATVRAMREAAREPHEVIEGTAVEVRRHG